ncbi:MAG: AsnC family transcriptional regulator [Candidatus Bathyarchaeota archaeon]|nr:AsnC family transcriptional regulator [Candidatus Bathyarchaeota archaeon]
MYLNPVSVGYESLAEIGLITDLADSEKVAKSLRTNPLLLIVPSSIGKYNIYGVVKAKKLNELTETVKQIDIKPHVKTLDLLIFADIGENLWHPENLVVKLSERKKPITRPNKPIAKYEPVPLDETDIHIAKMLMENSRTPFKEIAEKLKISTKTVIQRYKFLREKKVLTLSSISIDLFKLGYNAVLDSFMKVDIGKLREIETQLLQIPNLIYCAKFVGGAYDLRTAIIVADFQDVFRLKEQILSIKNMKTVEFYLHEIPGPWPYDFIGKTLLN